MAKHKTSDASTDMSINMTPMIDCVFQLILFFILAGQAASIALTPVELYEPLKSQARKWREQEGNRAIVNVPSKAGTEDLKGETLKSHAASAYVILGKKFPIADVDGVTAELKRLYAPYQEKGQDYYLEIRADQRVSYIDVEPLLYAAQQAGIPKLNISAILANE